MALLRYNLHTIKKFAPFKCTLSAFECVVLALLFQLVISYSSPRRCHLLCEVAPKKHTHFPL